MKRRKLAAALALVLSMTGSTGCSASVSGTEMFTERDSRIDYDEDSSVLISLNGDSAEASSNAVQITGSTITITEEAAYVISGTLDDGMVIVNAPDDAKIQIVLDGAEINSETFAPLYILEADKVFLTLAGGTENVLTNGGTFEAIDDNHVDSVIFSKQDLTINGTGALEVSSPAGHGIVSKDDLVVTGGTYTIASASHGLEANDSIRITGETTFQIDAGKDGMHAENDEDSSLGFVYISDGTIGIEAEGDGISAGSCLQILGGDFSITAGGGSENAEQEMSGSWGDFGGGLSDGRGGGHMMQGSMDNGITDDSGTSMKGMKATESLVIVDGNFQINSADDAIHSNGSLAVNGGDFEISTGDDAFHADDTLTVTDGIILIEESYEGLEALHLDIQGGDITLTASDDGLNAAGGNDESGYSGGRDGMFGGWQSQNSDGTIAVSGGTLHITAYGDGIDANGTVEITGGTITSEGPVQGDTSILDYDLSATISSAAFIGTGSSMMLQSFSDSDQGVILIQNGSQEAGTEIMITDNSGNVLIETVPELPYNTILISSPELVPGETYTVSIGGNSTEIQAD